MMRNDRTDERIDDRTDGIRAIVLEVDGKSAAVLTEDGDFQKTEDRGYEAGEDILLDFESMDADSEEEDEDFELFEAGSAGAALLAEALAEKETEIKPETEGIQTAMPDKADRNSDTSEITIIPVMDGEADKETGRAADKAGKNAGRRKHIWRRTWMKYASAAAAALLITVAAGGAYTYAQPYGVVSLDADTSIEFTINRFDRVLSAEAVNADGAALPKSLNFRAMRHRKINDVIEDTLKELETVSSQTEISSQDSAAGAAIQSDDTSENERIVVFGINTRDAKHSERLNRELGMLAEIRPDTVAVERPKRVFRIYSAVVTDEEIREARDKGMTPGRLHFQDKLEPPAFMEKETAEIVEDADMYPESESSSTPDGGRPEGTPTDARGNAPEERPTDIPADSPGERPTDVPTDTPGERSADTPADIPSLEGNASGAKMGADTAPGQGRPEYAEPGAVPEQNTQPEEWSESIGTDSPDKDMTGMDGLDMPGMDGPTTNDSDLRKTDTSDSALGEPGMEMSGDKEFRPHPEVGERDGKAGEHSDGRGPGPGK